MMKKSLIILVIVFLASTSVSAESSLNIEIFDINKGGVVMRVPTNSFVQEEAKNNLQGITNVYGKFKPIPKEGYMIRIPLEPSIQLQNQWINQAVDQVIILFPVDEKPFLLVLDDGGKPIFFSFEGKNEALLKTIKNYSSDVA